MIGLGCLEEDCTHLHSPMRAAHIHTHIFGSRLNVPGFFQSGIFDTIPRRCVSRSCLLFYYLLAKKSVQMPRWLAPRSAVDYST